MATATVAKRMEGSLKTSSGIIETVSTEFNIEICHGEDFPVKKLEILIAECENKNDGSYMRIRGGKLVTNSHKMALRALSVVS